MVDKAALRRKFSKDWKKHYNLSLFKSEKFKRQKCKKCGMNFWATYERDNCGDSACIGSFEFIGKSPTKRKLDFTSVWKKYSKVMSKLGYDPIKRYPVIARWRDDTWFTQASIYCFQPHVVSGEVKPPAKALVMSQPSLRFNDLENVGITGSHYSCHMHLGQHTFVSPKEYKPSKYLSDIFVWLNEGLTIPKDDLIFREDVWAGGGNFGPSIEYFSRGLELGNQVYMQYKETGSGPKELDIKVLDMGAGQERACWFTFGTPTSYEIVFEPVDNIYRKKIGLKLNKKLLDKFALYSGSLNIDEVSDLERAWKDVSKKVGYSPDELKETLLPMKAFYSVLDHSRALLFALADGALPSNSGGGYNLRFILRRALRFIDQYQWNIDLRDLARDHAKSLYTQYPELKLALPEVEKILEVEYDKYKDTKGKSRQVISNFLKKNKKVSEKNLIDLYDTQGILPEEVQAIARESKIKIKISDDFYSKVAEKHTDKKAKSRLSNDEIPNVRETYPLYYDDEFSTEFEAKVLAIIDNRFVVLNETLFYPTSGGQYSDTGTLNGCNVINVEKWGKHIVHEVEDINFKKGQIVVGEIDWNRRIAVMRHHTATHIVNGVVRSILGDHIWQAGSEVTPEKARLDITHYEYLDFDTLQEIERKANKIELADVKVEKSFMSRDKAEKAYGFRLYQGGAVPGSKIRVVNTKGFDVEACGGTHVNSTGEVGFIKVLGSRKIQDGVVRLEFCAGERGVEELQKVEKLLHDASDILRVQPEQLPKTVNRFFTEWKQQRKEIKKLKKSTK